METTITPTGCLSDVETYVHLVDYPEYEILNDYPYTIRNRKTQRKLKEFVNEYGYVMVSLRGKNVRKHRLIATQFIPNPHSYNQVDHINNDRSDYHLENLMWTNNMRNSNNRESDTLITALPDDYIEIVRFNGWLFDDLYYADDVFYRFNGKKYKKISTFNKQCGTAFIQVYDANHVRRSIYYPMFKRHMGIE